MTLGGFLFFLAGIATAYALGHRAGRQSLANMIIRSSIASLARAKAAPKRPRIDGEADPAERGCGI